MKHSINCIELEKHYDEVIIKINNYIIMTIHILDPTTSKNLELIDPSGKLTMSVNELLQPLKVNEYITPNGIRFSFSIVNEYITPNGIRFGFSMRSFDSDSPAFARCGNGEYGNRFSSRNRKEKLSIDYGYAYDALIDYRRRILSLSNGTIQSYNQRINNKKGAFYGY